NRLKAPAGERGLMLLLNDQTRAELWRRLIEVIESYLTKIDSARVAPELDVEKIRAELTRRDFAAPAPAGEALDFVPDAMVRGCGVGGTHEGCGVVGGLQLGLGDDGDRR